MSSSYRQTAYRDAILAKDWHTDPDLRVRLGGFLANHVVPDSESRTLLREVAEWYKTYGPPQDRNTYVHGKTGTTPLTSAMQEVQKIKDSLPAWKLKGPLDCKEDGPKVVLGRDIAGKGALYNIRCTAVTEASLFTPWANADLDTEKVILLLPLEDAAVDTVAALFKLGFKAPCQIKAEYPKRAMRTFIDQPLLLEPGIAKLVKKLTGYDGELSLIKYYWFEDEFTKVNTKLTDLVAEDKDFLKGTIRADLLTSKQVKAIQAAIDEIGSPDDFFQFLQTKATGYTICITDIQEFPFTLPAFCSILSSKRCKLHPDTVFLFPIRAEVAKLPRDDGGSYLKSELVAASQVFKQNPKAEGNELRGLLEEGTALEGKRLDTFMLLLDFVHTYVYRKWNYKRQAKIGDRL